MDKQGDPVARCGNACGMDDSAMAKVLAGSRSQGMSAFHELQRGRGSRLRVALLSIGCLASACSSPPGKESVSPQVSLPSDVSERHEPTLPLVPGPDGTPLPPRNPGAARNWPPEFRRFVDEALVLFRPRTREPTLEEFEMKLGIKLLPGKWKKTEDDGRMQVYRVEAPWIYRVKPTDPPRWADLSTLTELPRPYTTSPEAGLRIYMLKFVMDKGLYACINPYDLAVYTGATFTNYDQSPHQLPRPIWARAYEWGMFKRGYYGTYTSNKGFTISVNSTSSIGPAQHDATCVTSFWISNSFESE